MIYVLNAGQWSQTMSKAECGKWLRLMLTLLFILAMVYVASERSYEYQKAKGEAISRYMQNHLGVDINPNDARFLNINVNQWDVEFKDINIFPK